MILCTRPSKIFEKGTLYPCISPSSFEATVQMILCTPPDFQDDAMYSCTLSSDVTTPDAPMRGGGVGER